ncbi:hypothetical protein NQ318_012994 [Aromia moschata]|uniref:Uncharacterized protein n=1 Tax=Aromia moschata TaxID=1265417 RepID=A0AAV8Y3R6_9CUCU|nr:hypothetical protein NQ318_012994 [Aromia moschata]
MCFASDLDTAQRILLQNFNMLTETVFFQETSFFGDLRHSQKEENRFKSGSKKPFAGTKGHQERERCHDFMESI